MSIHYIVLLNQGKAISDAVRTSLGPKGMDKMVCFLLRLFLNN